MDDVDNPIFYFWEIETTNTDEILYIGILYNWVHHVVPTSVSVHAHANCDDAFVQPATRSSF